jgi:hypothetical protein
MPAHSVATNSRRCSVTALSFDPFGYVRHLRADLYPITIGIDYNALVIAIARTSRTIDDHDSVAAETLRELIDEVLRTYRDREMGQPKTLSSRDEFNQRQRCGRHRFEARPIGETKKA